MASDWTWAALGMWSADSSVVMLGALKLPLVMHGEMEQMGNLNVTTPIARQSGSTIVVR